MSFLNDKDYCSIETTSKRMFNILRFVYWCNMNWWLTRHIFDASIRFIRIIFFLCATLPEDIIVVSAALYYWRFNNTTYSIGFNFECPTKWHVCFPYLIQNMWFREQNGVFVLFLFSGLSINACYNSIGSYNHSNIHWLSLAFSWSCLLWFSPFCSISYFGRGGLCLNILYKPLPTYCPESCLKYFLVIIIVSWRKWFWDCFE